MKKGKPNKRASMRRSYQRDDFPGGLARGKYAGRVERAVNVVRLNPDIAAAFPTSKAVNDALRTVLRAARIARLSKPSRVGERNKR